MRAVQSQGYTIRLDLRGQVLAIDVPQDVDFDIASLMAEGDTEHREAEAPLHASLADVAGTDFVSASVLAHKAKQFDDGLYAAVELAAQNGLGDFAGKAALLKLVAARLAEVQPPQVDEAAAIIFAASELGGLRLPLSPKLLPAIRHQLDGFQHDDVRSKPISFYTWSEDLSRIFRQDRMLQTELHDREGVRRLADVLRQDPAAGKMYVQCLALAEELTNPFAGGDLRPFMTAPESGAVLPTAQRVSFFPPSVAPETELIKRLYGDMPIPDGFVLADELIRRIRAGELSLKPREESGWYDHQLWSLEPLVTAENTPEAKHLQLSQRYRDQLVELFKGILAQARETHIKQLESPIVGTSIRGHRPKPEFHIRPELCVEPLATHYLRRARSYRFVRGVIERIFNKDALKEMRRLTIDGPVQDNLDVELWDMEALLDGAYVTVCRQLGMTPDAAMEGRDADADAARFEEWRESILKDTDVGRDARMMVPIFVDVLRNKTKVWVFLGWSSRPVDISFATPPKADVFDARDRRVDESEYEMHFEGICEDLMYPVTAEVYVSKLLDRAEFRRHCDQHKTRKAILENLS